MSTAIYKLLSDLRLIKESSEELYSHGTRDRENIKVFRDSDSGVIYIKDFYIGDEEYERGDYRYGNEHNLSNSSANFEAMEDLERRLNAYRRFAYGKKVIDFGCGQGDFLMSIEGNALEVCGIELQQNYVEHLNEAGIPCFTNLDALHDNTFDLVTMFHVLEHLPDPQRIFTDLSRIVSSNAKFIIEVPHANDLLLSHLNNQDFKNFTLWSQHLILHTRQSLYALLSFFGLKNIKIQGVQRYGLSNHLHWMRCGQPGGHKSNLAAMETDALKVAYEASLRKLDATDTIVAIGEL